MAGFFMDVSAKDKKNKKKPKNTTREKVRLDLG